jgi:hypothetical protein
MKSFATFAHGASSANPVSKVRLNFAFIYFLSEPCLRLTGSPEDDAKIAAYREAFAREEIMLELQSAVQTRTERGPYTEDPAEKRQQLVLEEIYAQRVPAMQA